jgi:hypothetical protein
MAQRFGLWSRMWRSAWCAEAYRDAASRSVGSAFGYLAVLIAIAAAVTALVSQVRVGQAVAMFKAQRLWEAYLPEIRLTDGTVSSPVEQPFVRELDGTVLILDTTGQTTELDPQYEQGLLITEREIVLRRGRGVTQETRRYTLDRLPDLVLNQATAERFLDQVKAWTWVVVGLGMLIWLWIAKPVQVLVWSLLGVVVNAVAKRRLSYRAIFNVGVLALTVPLVFGLVRTGFGWISPWLWWLSLGLCAAYVVWGVLAQPEPAVATSSSQTHVPVS